jgi:hypothetical protein
MPLFGLLVVEWKCHLPGFSGLLYEIWERLSQHPHEISLRNLIDRQEFIRSAQQGAMSSLGYDVLGLSTDRQLEQL